MDIDLTPCTNPAHKFKLFGAQGHWQIANKHWSEKLHDGLIVRHFFSIRYLETKESDIGMWSIIIGKLWVAIGVLK